MSQKTIKVIYDFECFQVGPNDEEWAEQQQQLNQEHLPIPEDENYRLHTVNCVSVGLMENIFFTNKAMYFCNRCMDNGQWKVENNTGQCSVCGPNRKRMQTWTTAMNENPLGEFLKWLLTGLPGGQFRPQKLFAIAHYGGLVSISSRSSTIPSISRRYDMHLMLGEILRFRGGLEPPKIIRSG